MSDEEYFCTFVGPGWHELVKTFLRLIEKYPGCKIEQVKEKFGQLRIYYSGGPESLQAVVVDLEKRSLHICENCGKEGILRSANSYWLQTLCENCCEKK